MKPKLFLPTLLILAMAAPALHAAAPKETKMTEWEYLRDAYKTVSMSKKDYGGHRKKAMEAIETACDKLNHDVRGEGRQKEPQDVSDAQLREARRLLEEAHTIIMNHHQPEVTKNVERAMGELDAALAMK